jgi:hypothetical protein
MTWSKLGSAATTLRDVYQVSLNAIQMLSWWHTLFEFPMRTVWNNWHMRSSLYDTSIAREALHPTEYEARTFLGGGEGGRRWFGLVLSWSWGAGVPGGTWRRTKVASIMALGSRSPWGYLKGISRQVGCSLSKRAELALRYDEPFE